MPRTGLILAGAALLLAGAYTGGQRLAPHTFYHGLVSLERAFSGLQEKTVRVGRFQIHYLEGGDGEPLLLLHGFGADKDNWTRLARQLNHSFRVIAPDLPGFGESDHPTNADYGVRRQAERMRNFVRQLGLGRVHVAGNSMGGYIAGVFGAQYPETTSSLWLIAPAGVLEAEPSDLDRRLEMGDNPLLPSTKAEYEALIDYAMHQPPYMPWAIVELLAQRNIERRPLLSDIFETLRTSRVSLTEELARSPVPALVVWGEHDRLLDPSGARPLAEAMSAAEVRIMADAGHIPMLERPGQLARDYLEWQQQWR